MGKLKRILDILLPHKPYTGGTVSGPIGGVVSSPSETVYADPESNDYAKIVTAEAHALQILSFQIRRDNLIEPSSNIEAWLWNTETEKHTRTVIPVKDMIAFILSYQEREGE